MNLAKRPPSEADLLSSAKEAQKWAKALDVTTPEEGWYTCEKLGEMMNLKSTAIREKMKKALQDGLCERRLFYVSNGNKTFSVPHYRLL
jgi:predicted transcriptional regulator